MAHIPNLMAIDAVEDPAVRLYAIIGASISLAAAVEHAMFEVYVVASDQDEAAAAPIFYRHVRFSHKRDVTDDAVRRLLPLKANPHLSGRWDELVQHAQDLLGSDTARNLVGHNAVSSDLAIELDENDAFLDAIAEFEVNQNHHMVRAGLRPSRRVEFDALRFYAQRLITLRLRLSRFAASLREARAESLP